MSNLLTKKRLLAVLTLLSLNAMSSSLFAMSDCCDPCDSGRMYIGAFGGGIYSESSRTNQLGTAFFTEAEGGPLAVNARGHTGTTSAGFGGIQLGYEWAGSAMGCSDWSIAPAAELEAYWMDFTKRGDLINDTARLPEHDFSNSFPMHTGVYLVNAVLAFNSCCYSDFSPYVGGGIGAMRISIKNATSTQVSPAEPGINHFNSDRNYSTWAFAAQAKVGLRYNVCDSFHIFGEYRYLYIDSSNYVFGATIEPTHAPTSPWNVRVQNIQFNAFVFGLQYDL